MALQPNLGGLLRVVYVLAGIVLAAWGFAGVDTGWLRVALPIGGALLVIEGLVGF